MGGNEINLRDDPEVFAMFDATSPYIFGPNDAVRDVYAAVSGSQMYSNGSYVVREFSEQVFCL